MDIAAVLSILGQGPGRLTPQGAGAAVSSDFSAGFSDMFDELAEAPAGEPVQGDPAGDAESGGVEQQLPVLAEAVLFFPATALKNPDLAIGATAETSFRAFVPGPPSGPVGAGPEPSVLPSVADCADGDAVALPAAPDNEENATQALAEGGRTPDLRDHQTGRAKENPPAPIGKSAQNPDPMPTGKDRVPQLPLHAAAHDQAPDQLSQPMPEREGRGHDMRSATPEEKPLARENQAGAPRRQEMVAPLRAGLPDRPMPTGSTDPAGVPRDERREAPTAFAGRWPILPGAEVTGRSVWDAGREPEVRAEVQGVPPGLVPREGKDALPRPKAANPVADQVQALPFGLPDGGPDRSRGLPFGPGAPPVARSPHAIGVQLADRMPATVGQPVEITLAPEELGKVRMTMSASDGALTLQLVADRPETLDLMRRHIDQLAQDFRDMGFDRLSFAFGQGQKENQQARQPAPADPPDHESASHLVPPTAGTAHRRADLLPHRPDDRLDLRF